MGNFSSEERFEVKTLDFGSEESDTPGHEGLLASAVMLRVGVERGVRERWRKSWWVREAGDHGGMQAEENTE